MMELVILHVYHSEVGIMHQAGKFKPTKPTRKMVCKNTAATVQLRRSPPTGTQCCTMLWFASFTDTSGTGETFYFRQDAMEQRYTCMYCVFCDEARRRFKKYTPHNIYIINQQQQDNTQHYKTMVGIYNYNIKIIERKKIENSVRSIVVLLSRVQGELK